jgi:hypothetical protein
MTGRRDETPLAWTENEIEMAGRIYDALALLDPGAFLQGDPRRNDYLDADVSDIDVHVNLRAMVRAARLALA